MIEITNTGVVGWQAAIRGMRNPMNSWSKSDSHTCNCDEGCRMVENGHEPYNDECDDGKIGFCIGKNDYVLMEKLSESGTDHRKFMRMIVVYADIVAPLYWWKEYDTYKVGTVANSCSTMHKIHAKAFDMDDFSNEKLDFAGAELLWSVIDKLNEYRRAYLKSGDKDTWYSMIQLLPSSYNQRRTVMLNYEVLANIYHSRKNHKLDEWHKFCDWIKELPYSKLITGEELQRL